MALDYYQLTLVTTKQLVVSDQGVVVIKDIKAFLRITYVYVSPVVRAHHTTDNLSNISSRKWTTGRLDVITFAQLLRNLKTTIFVKVSARKDDLAHSMSL